MLSDLLKKLDTAVSEVAALKVAADTASVNYAKAQEAYAKAATSAREIERQVLAAVAETLGDARVRQS